MLPTFSVFLSATAFSQCENLLASGAQSAEAWQADEKGGPALDSMLRQAQHSP
jgi:hypothetical protein